MNNAIGLLELKSTPIGIASCDEMLKAADVQLLLSSPMCPGKYIIIVAGSVDTVQSAVDAGVRRAGIFLCESAVLNNIHPCVIPGISGLAEPDEIKSLAMMESISALSAIIAVDAAAKAADTQLVDLRIARGLGGKSFAILTGELSAVEAGAKAALAQLESGGTVTSWAIVASPHKALIETLGQ